MDPNPSIREHLTRNFGRIRDSNMWSYITRFTTQQVELRKRKQPVLYLFLGYKQSGKTTAIKHICSTLADIGSCSRNFTSLDSPENYSISSSGLEPMFDMDHLKTSFQKWSLNYADTQMTFVEAPSFTSSFDINYNASLITATNQFLAKYSDTAIPTKVFITAPLNGNRFEGEFSEFSIMLKYLKCLGNRLSDCHWSNLVLLLTNVDKTDIGDTVKERVSAYKSQFKEILGVEPICYTTGESITHFSISKMEILDWQYQNYAREPSLETEDNDTIRVRKEQEMKLSDLLEDNVNVPNYLLEIMHSGMFKSSKNVFKETNFLINFVPADLKFVACSNVLGHFDPEHIKTQYGLDLSKDKMYNVVDPRSQVILSNGKLISGSDCNVGNRVLGHDAIGVITTCVKIECQVVESTRSSTESLLLFCELFHGVEQESESRFIQLQSNSDAFSLARDQPQFQPKFNPGDNNPVMYIEIDGGHGTFVADGYVRKCCAFK